MYTVLICDDDKDIVSALEIYLTSEGYRTVSAYNGEEAIAAVRTENIDLILMDVMMPRLDGLSALMRIRERANIPVIVLSAKSEETDKVLGLSMGADDYVTKPYHPAELVARVKSQIRRYTSLGDINAPSSTGSIVNVIAAARITAHKRFHPLFITFFTAYSFHYKEGLQKLHRQNFSILPRFYR